MDAELARQLGHGLNNLSNQLLEHQKASARDRSAMLTKIDAINDKMDSKFDALAREIVDVCDRGGSEHRGFASRLDAIELRLATQEARKQGSDQTRQAFAAATTWTLEHGWKLALVVFVAWQSLAPMLARSVAPAAATQQLRGFTQ